MHPDICSYDNGYSAGYQDAVHREREYQLRAEDAERRANETEAAIRENSVVLLALIAVTQDETVQRLAQHVHDSLTDAL